jgi:hypothetical protein
MSGRARRQVWEEQRFAVEYRPNIALTNIMSRQMLAVDVIEVESLDECFDGRPIHALSVLQNKSKM